MIEKDRSWVSPIRLARPDDLELVTLLMGEFYVESGYPLDHQLASAALAQLIEDRELGRLWLILDAGNPVGYIAVTFGFSLEYYGRDAFIDDLFIQLSSRGRRLGTRVLEAIELECRMLGIRALHLEVGRTNQAALALYRSQGFRDNDRQLLSKHLAPD
ncbi:MAG TPA: GNAT family N-acetyltransferase [Gemmatimonadota bacterium]|nr:GNAT family N-acetyltransferase [Gemmatimonadota bacterium]